MIVLYIVILIYFNFNVTSIVNVFMLSIEKKNPPEVLLLTDIERMETFKTLHYNKGEYVLPTLHVNI